MEEDSTSRYLAASTNQNSIPLFLYLIHVPFRFERELEALRKELAEATARSGRSSPTSGADSLVRDLSNEDLVTCSPVSIQNGLPTVSSIDVSTLLYNKEQ